MSLATFIETARGLTAEAAGSAGRLMATGAMEESDIKRMLEGGSDRDKVSALKAIHRLMASDTDSRVFFASAIKNVASQNDEIRALVSSYLVKYAHTEPDLALLAINGIQKLLSSHSPVTRAHALTTMSLMQVSAISNIVCVSLEEISTDPSPIVRVAVARAAVNCVKIDTSLSSRLLQVLCALLDDKSSPLVVGASLASFAYGFENRLDLLHSTFRKVCAQLEKMDEFDLIKGLPLLVNYARKYMGPEYEDVELLRSKLVPLLYFLNPAVVVEAANAMHYLETKDFGEPAAALLSLPQSSFVCQNILVLCSSHQTAFRPYISRLYPLPGESHQVQTLKLKALAALVNEKTAAQVFSELRFTAQVIAHENGPLKNVMETVAACASKSRDLAPKVSRWLLRRLTKQDSTPELLAQALVALRMLMRPGVLGTESDRQTLNRLVQVLGTVELPCAATASILWLLGEYSGVHPDLAAEALRRVLRTRLVGYGPESRLQAVQLAAELYSRYLESPEKCDERVPQLFSYAMQLGRYDQEYDTRDRTRMFNSILGEPEARELACLLLQTSKPPPTIKSDSSSEFRLDTASLALGHPLNGYVSILPWGYEDENLRDVEAPKPIVVQKQPSPESVPVQKKHVTLEEFLGGDSDTDSEEDSEEEEETSEEEDQESESATPLVQ